MRFTLHPVFRLVASQPQLLADHLEAYAELLSVQLAGAVHIWKQRAVIMTAAYSLGVVSISLAGVSSMLWAVTPVGQIHQPIIMIAAPLIPALAAIICWLIVRGQNGINPFDQIREQIRSDLVMWREASPP